VGTANCSVTGTTLSYTNGGTCSVTATKAADTNYNIASSAAQTFTVSLAPQTALVTPVETVIYTPSGDNFVALSTTGGSGSGAVTFAVTAAGSANCSVTGTTLSYTNA
jgi:hypothetical protein